MTANDWYVLKDDRQTGPITEIQLLDFLAKGTVQPSDWIWRQGLPNWIPAERFNKFAELRPPPLPEQSFAFRRFTPPPLPKGFTVVPGGLNLHVSQSPLGITSAERDHISSPPKGTRNQNYIARHWRGELSLPVSFWFNGFLGYFVATFGVLVIGASSRLRDEFSPTIALLSIVVAWAITFLALAWQVVGAWRAATEYSNNSANVFWPAAAKFCLCIAVVSTLIQFAGHGFPQIQERYGIYAGDEEVGKYAFRVLRDGAELEFSGGITFGAAKDFARFLDAMSTLTTVHLNSIGGRIQEAQRFGDLIKSRKLDTYVTNRCLSACTIVFLSGNRRFITRNAKIGFHQPDAAGLSDDERDEMIKHEERRLQGFGLSPRFARHANEAPPNDMWVPSAQELVDEKVATQIVDSSRFALSGLAASDLTLEGVDKILHDIPKYEAVAKMDGNAYRQLRTQLWEGLQKGKSGPEIATQIDPIVDSLFEKALPHTTVANLLDYTNMTIRHMRMLNRDDPAFCYVYINPEQDKAELLTLLSSKYPLIVSDQNAVKSEVLTSYQGEVPIGLSKDAVSTALADAMRAVEKKLGKDATLIANKMVGKNEYSAYCGAMASFYEEILKLPATTRTASLRTLFR